ncbi:MAG: Do family serine endopeptidase [Aureliella sp.]
MLRSKKVTLATIALGLAAGGWVSSSWLASNQSQAFAQPPALELPSETEAYVGAEKLSSAFRTAAARLRPSVVTIASMVKPQQVVLRGGGIPRELRGFLPEEMLRELDRGNQQNTIPDQSGIERVYRPKQAGVGSGVIVSADGYVLTNNHVIDEADALEVELADGRVYEAEVVGTAPGTDLALLKIDATGLQAARLGDASAMQVGDWVLAIGSPFGLSQTVTAGIISATHRQTGILSDRGGYEDFIQTDASINPGNSGGPLVNLRGEVIGINTAINSRTGSDTGVGFAVPSDIAQRVISDLQNDGKVEYGFIGAQLDAVTRETAQRYKLPAQVRRGVVLTSVVDDLPAQRSGLQAGDVITEVAGRQIRSIDGLKSAVAITRPGDTLPFTVWRDGSQLELNVTVGRRPEPAELTKFSGEFTVASLGISLFQVPTSDAANLGLRGIDQVYVVTSLERNGRGLQELELRPRDIILEVNGRAIKSKEQLLEAVQSSDSLNLTVQRNGRIISLPRAY